MRMLDQLKIASPCSADWEQMEGDERVRFCGECKKNVFSLSAMTRRDAEKLLVETNGNLCTRLYRRADGTVLTADCPVGLKVKVARVRRRIGWAIAGAMGFATAWGQNKPLVLSGVVDDPMLAVIPNANVTAINLKSGKKVLALTDQKGEFRFDELEPGVYNVSAVAPGFAESTTKNVTVGDGGRKLQFVLRIGNVTMGGPIVAALPRP
jgi:Carboxypeptidase regulatory-like domain